MNAGRPFSTLVIKEFADALRSRWLMGFSAAFAFLALGISVIGSLGSSVSGYAGFGRTTATLVNLILFMVPLMGLSAGGLSLSGERERGTLGFLLSLPVRPAHVFWAKFAGLGMALTAALAAAFGLAGLGLAWKSGLRDTGLYLGCFGLTLLLALASLGGGLLLSSLTRRTAQSVGAVLLVWLGLVFIGDLGLLGTSLAVRLRPEVLLTGAALNPLTIYRLLAIRGLGAPLEILGPAGLCAQDLLGRGLWPIGLTALGMWAAATAALAFWIYQKDPLRQEKR